MYDPSDLSGEKQSSSHETDSKDLSGQEVSPHSASANQFSLRTLLPSARFLTENDISFHSVSKGFIGECGIRGGYFELYNIDDAVKQNLYKLASISLCSNTHGQVSYCY